MPGPLGWPHRFGRCEASQGGAGLPIHMAIFWWNSYSYWRLWSLLVLGGRSHTIHATEEARSNRGFDPV